MNKYRNHAISKVLLIGLLCGVLICILILVLLYVGFCSQHKTVSIDLGNMKYNESGEEEIYIFSSHNYVSKNQLISKLKTATYKQENRMPSDCEIVQIIFDKESEENLILAFDYETDLLYAKYSNTVYLLQNYEKLVSYIGKSICLNQYTIINVNYGCFENAYKTDYTTVYLDASFRFKRYFYNNDYERENFVFFDEKAETTIKGEQEIFDRAISMLECTEYLAYVMYDKTSSMWAVEVYDNCAEGEWYKRVVLDQFGNVLFIYDPSVNLNGNN